MRRSKKRSSQRRNKSSIGTKRHSATSRDHPTVPTSANIKKLCKGEGLVIKDVHCIRKLQEVYRTLLIKIVKAAGNHKGAKKNISYEDIIFSLTSLFGTRIQSKLEDGSVVVDKGTFRRMFVETLDLLASRDKTASSEILDVMQKTVEVCLAKAFLAPLAAWQLSEKGMDVQPYVNMHGLQAVNQVHQVSGSEYFSPSLVINGS